MSHTPTVPHLRRSSHVGKEGGKEDDKKKDKKLTKNASSGCKAKPGLGKVTPS